MVMRRNIKHWKEIYYLYLMTTIATIIPEEAGSLISMDEKMLTGNTV